jgi:hypothetical protein
MHFFNRVRFVAAMQLCELVRPTDVRRWRILSYDLTAAGPRTAAGRRACAGVRGEAAAGQESSVVGVRHAQVCKIGTPLATQLICPPSVE